MDPSMAGIWVDVPMYKEDGQRLSEEECIDSFPLGFRFRPTDEELVGYYLTRKIKNLDMPACNRIREVDLYKFSTPNDLIEKYALIKEREKEWYFFTPITKKSVNGKRANRITPGGYWKATSGDAPVRSRGHTIGQKKTLCFYQGTNPAKKTNWIMHEFRTNSGDWVLCKIFERNVGSSMSTSTTQRAMVQVPNDGNEQQLQNEEPLYPIGPVYNANGLQQQSEEPLYPTVCVYNANEQQQQHNEEPLYAIVPAYNANELQQPTTMQQNQDFSFHDFDVDGFRREMEEFRSNLRLEAEAVDSLQFAQVPNDAKEHQQQNEEVLPVIVPPLVTNNANELQQPVIMEQNQYFLAPMVHSEMAAPNNGNQPLLTDQDDSWPYFDARVLDSYLQDMGICL